MILNCASVICDQIKLKSIIFTWNSRKQTDSHLLAISSLFPSKTLCYTQWSHDCSCNIATSCYIAVLRICSSWQQLQYCRNIATSDKIAAFRICSFWQQIHIAAILPQYFDFDKGKCLFAF